MAARRIDGKIVVRAHDARVVVPVAVAHGAVTEIGNLHRRAAAQGGDVRKMPHEIHIQRFVNVDAVVRQSVDRADKVIHHEQVAPFVPEVFGAFGERVGGFVGAVFSLVYAV